MKMRWCTLQTNEYDLQGKTYPIILTHKVEYLPTKRTGNKLLMGNEDDNHYKTCWTQVLNYIRDFTVNLFDETLSPVSVFVQIPESATQYLI